MRITFSFFFFFNDTATTEIYTLSLHDALPISGGHREATHPPRSDGRCQDRDRQGHERLRGRHRRGRRARERGARDRKSTRLNSSHGYISYAVFCLKKKKKQQTKLATDDDRHPQ